MSHISRVFDSVFIFQREHYVNWIKLWINKAVENVESVKGYYGYF